MVTALPAIARELEAGACQYYLEALTVEQAATESGFTADHLYRLVSGGKLENVGRDGAPRIRRADLPRSPADGVTAIDEVLERRQKAG